MPRRIRVRVVLNKGRHGVSLAKLPKVVGELQEFLDDLSEDVGLKDSAGWQGIDFRDGSLDFIAEKNTLVEEPQYAEFTTSARNVILNKPDDRVSRRTRSQYARIAAPIDPDEVVVIGVEKEQALQPDQEIGPPGDEFEWYELTKQTAQIIELSASATVRSLASVQGIIHSVFIEAEQPHFQLRELSSKSFVRCTYKEAEYSELAEALKLRRAVVHVYGLAYTDMLSRKIDRIDVDRIEVSPPLSKDFLDQFFGCAPGLINEDDIQDFINHSRQRAD
ncbi:MAG: hypothetical protein ACR2JB_01025 [Bryobacteraceae bacterium]